MTYIKTDQDFGIVIRKKGAVEKGIPFERIHAVMLEDNFLGENEELISYGPHFGIESAEEISDRLSKIGLEYWDDFFIFHGDIPYWISFGVIKRDD